jgi:hypothetical protein
MVSGRQPGLASTDNNCVNAFRTKLAFHSHPQNDDFRALWDSPHRTNCAGRTKILMGNFMYESDHSVLIREGGRGRARGDAEFIEDIADMAGDGLLADA